MVNSCPTLAIHLKITKVFLSKLISLLDENISENFIKNYISKFDTSKAWSDIKSFLGLTSLPIKILKIS